MEARAALRLDLRQKQVAFSKRASLEETPVQRQQVEKASRIGLCQTKSRRACGRSQHVRECARSGVRGIIRQLPQVNNNVQSTGAEKSGPGGEQGNAKGRRA